jgi:hypothetical protein
VAALRAAAEALGLSVHLALAEVHEQWTATVDGGGRRRGRTDPEPDELIERGIVLNHWVDADDRQLRRDDLPVADTDTAGFSPPVGTPWRGLDQGFDRCLDTTDRSLAQTSLLPGQPASIGCCSDASRCWRPPTPRWRS